MKFFIDMRPACDLDFAADAPMLWSLVAKALRESAEDCFFMHDENLLPRAFVEWGAALQKETPDAATQFLTKIAAGDVQFGALSKAMKRFAGEPLTGVFVSPMLHMNWFDFEAQIVGSGLARSELQSAGGVFKRGAMGRKLWDERAPDILSSVDLLLPLSQAAHEDCARNLRALGMGAGLGRRAPRIRVMTPEFISGPIEGAQAPSPKPRLHLVCPGVRQPDLAYLIEAVRRNPRYFEGVRIDLYPDPMSPPRPPVRAPDEIKLWPVQSDWELRAAISVADGVVTPRLWDPVARWCLEAGLLGVRCVAAASGATPERADAHSTQFFDPSEPDALSAALLRLENAKWGVTEAQELMVRARRAQHKSWKIEGAPFLRGLHGELLDLAVS